MKTLKIILKWIGLTILSFILLLLIAILLAKYVFKDQIQEWYSGSYQNELIENERHFIDLLKNSGDYISEDTLNIHYATIQDSVRAAEIREHFQLDTLYKCYQSKSET